MIDADKTEGQLADELRLLRARVAELERAAAEGKRTEEEHRVRLKRARVHQAAIVRLATHDTVVAGDFEEAARTTAEVAAEALEVERVGIWLLSEDGRQLRCVDLFERSVGAHSRDVVLTTEDHPRYFQALAAGRAIDACDAQSDPRTSEFTKEYLAPLGITSMLDAPIRRFGKVVGVVCHEHVGPRRTWQTDEITFAGEVSDQMAQALINRERKRAEEALRESEQRFKQVADNAQEWIWEADATGLYTYASVMVEQILGYKPEEVVGKKHFYDLFHPENREDLKKAAFEVFARKASFREFLNPNLDKNGNTVWLSTSGVPVLDESGNLLGYRGADTDITKRRRAETELRDSVLLLHTVISATKDAMISIGEEGLITIFNPAAEKMFGRKREEMIGKPLDCLMPEEYRQRHREYVRSYFATGEPRNAIGQILELPGLRSDGCVFPMEISLSAGQHGSKQFVIAVARDITERKREEEERRKLQAQIQHAQKLESLAVLASGIAHDFNNLLVGVLGYAGLVERELAPQSSARASVRKIEKAAQRAADLTKQLLAYSGRGRFLVEPVDLSGLVEEMVDLLEASISKEAVLKCDFAAELPLIEADATQLRQIVMNLITNASDALGGADGVITVRTGLTEADREDQGATYLGEDSPEGPCVYVEVCDSGCGMDEETRARIFDPFFTTKSNGRGLGLAAVLGIVRGHRGVLELRSEPGGGATFRVLFPCPDHSLTRPEAEVPRPEQARGGGVILVVDDEEDVRAVAKQTLEENGFSILVAADGREALEVFRAHRDDIALVLLDMTMPHLSGEKVFRELRRICPEVRVILSSGYSEEEATDRFAGRGPVRFIQKPYLPATLIEKVRTAFAP